MTRHQKEKKKKKCRICYTLKARLSGVLPGRRFCRSRCNLVRLGRKLTSEERRYIIWISKPLPGPVPIVSSGYHPALEDSRKKWNKHCETFDYSSVDVFESFKH